MRKRSSVCRILRLRRPRSSTAFRAPMPSVGIAMQSTNSLSGTAPSRDYRSAGPFLSGTECTWSRGTSPQALLTSASTRCVALHTKPRTASFSAQIWRREYDVSSVNLPRSSQATHGETSPRTALSAAQSSPGASVGDYGRHSRRAEEARGATELRPVVAAIPKSN
jgi:hypothetical protein